MRWDAVLTRISGIGSVADGSQRAADRLPVASFWLRGGRPARFGGFWVRGTDESQGPGMRWDAVLTRISGIGSVADGSRRAADRLPVASFWLRGGRPARFGGFWVRGIGAGGCRRAGRSGRRALGCRWARVDDVSKSRRLGLVGLPRDLPFEGLSMRAPVSRSRPPSSPLLPASR